MSPARLFAALSAAVALLSAVPARAELITLYGNSEQPPKAWLDNGTPRGFGIETATEVLKRAGFEVNVSLLPYARALEQVKQGGIMTGVFRSAEGDRYFYYSDPLVYEEVVMVVLKGKDFPFASAADLKGKKIGMQVTFFYGDEFTAALPQLVTETDGSPSTRLKKLAAGRIDVALLNPGRAAVLRSAAEGGVSAAELTVLPKPLATLANHLVVGRDIPGALDLLARVNKAIAAATNDDTLPKIMDKYGQ
jgi:polar amino acid transport system substrate-binding protein